MNFSKVRRFNCNLRLGILAITLVVGGCDDSSDGRFMFEFGGTPTSPTLCWSQDGPPERWIAAADPTWSVGDSVGDIYFRRISFAYRDEDGRRYLLHESEGQILTFSADGTLEHVVGREGEGPGEFREATYLQQLRGDSLLVFDSELVRTTLISPTGRVYNVAQLVPALPGASLVGVDGEGAFIVTGQTFSQSRRDSLLVLRYSANGAIVDTLTAIPHIEFYAIEHQGRTMRGQAAYMNPGFAGVISGKVVAGSGDLPFVLVWPRGATVPDTIRVPCERGAVDSEVRDHFIDIAVKDLEATQQHSMRAYLEKIPYGDSIPRYTFAHVDGHGNIWLSRFDYSEFLPTSWLVLNPKGETIARATTPNGVTIKQIGTDFMMVIRRDSIGMLYAEQLPILRSDAS